MKIIICTIFVFLLCCAVLASCQNGAAAEGVDDTTEAQTEASMTADTEAGADFDFSRAQVSGHILLTADGEKTMADCTDFHVQKPEVAEVLDGGRVCALSSGVTLIAYKDGEGLEKICACCVLEEGVRPDPSGSSPKLFEAGDSTSLTGSQKLNSQITSSNESAVAVGDDNVLHFLSPGYAVVTVEGVSVPEFYSYIVFER